VIDIYDLYFDWLLLRLDSRGVPWTLENLCILLYENPFERRVGNDINRAADGANLRKAFLMDYDEAEIDPRLTNELLEQDCTWLEMLIALAESLDYLYDGGVLNRFIELVTNAGFGPIIMTPGRPEAQGVVDEFDRQLVARITTDIDHNRFDRDGHGGLFPLQKDDHPDQREVEIWEQHAAYFREKLEGVLWTSTH